jgi:hypothetical protein
MKFALYSFLQILMFMSLLSAEIIDNPENFDVSAVLKQQENLFYIFNSLDSLDTSPELNFRIAAGNKGFELGKAYQQRFGQNLFLEARLIFSNQDNAEFLLGTNYSRGDWTGRLSHGTVRWQNAFLGVEFGRRNLSRQRDTISELVVSRHIPANDMLRYFITSTNKRWQLEVMNARLSAANSSSFNRWLASHRLEFYSKDKNLRLAIGDYVLYTGENRGIDIRYMNPFNPFFLENFEGYSERDVTNKPDNDNSVFFFEWDYQLPLLINTVDIRSYGELALDEFQIDDQDRDKFDDVWAMTLGFDIKKRLANDSQLRMIFEGSRLLHWFYIHPGLETSYIEKDRPLGNQEGGDCLESHFHLQWWPNSESMSYLAFELDRISKGAINFNDIWDPESTFGESVPSSPMETETSLGFRLFYEINKQFSLGANIARNLDSESNVFRFRLRYDLSYDIPGAWQ